MQVILCIVLCQTAHDLIEFEYELIYFICKNVQQSADLLECMYFSGNGTGWVGGDGADECQ